MLRRRPAARPGRRRDRPDDREGRGPCPRRRVGVGQDDHRPGHRQADPPDRRQGDRRRQGRLGRLVGRRAEGVPPAGPAHLPGPVRDAQPETDDPRLRGRAARGQPSRHVACRPRGPGPGGDRGGRSPAGRRVRLPLPARAVRRPAAAGRHRGCPGDGTGARRRRRAGVDARRLDPDRAAAAHARPPEGARADVPVHHPRPVVGLGHRRPDRRHVPRSDHGDRTVRGGDQALAPSLHARARRRVAVTRPRRRCARAARVILKGETPNAAAIPDGCRFHPRCPLAFDRCRVEEPPLFDVGAGQQAACWLAEGGRELPVLQRQMPEPVVATAPAAPAGPAGPGGHIGPSLDGLPAPEPTA